MLTSSGLYWVQPVIVVLKRLAWAILSHLAHIAPLISKSPSPHIRLCGFLVPRKIFVRVGRVSYECPEQFALIRLILVPEGSASIHVIRVTFKKLIMHRQNLLPQFRELFSKFFSLLVSISGGRRVRTWSARSQCDGALSISLAEPTSASSGTKPIRRKAVVEVQSNTCNLPEELGRDTPYESTEGGKW